MRSEDAASSALPKGSPSIHEGAEGAPQSWPADLYRELRAQAARHLRWESPGHTLQPTALIHEAFLRLRSVWPKPCESRAAFMGAAAATFRRILIDHARRRQARKRRGEHGRRVEIEWSEEAGAARTLAVDPIDVLVLHEALDHLSRIDERAGRVVELRVFGGLTHPQIAEVLAISVSSVEEDWRFARVWLASRLMR